MNSRLLQRSLLIAVVIHAGIVAFIVSKNAPKTAPFRAVTNTFEIQIESNHSRAPRGLRKKGPRRSYGHMMLDLPGSQDPYGKPSATDHLPHQDGYSAANAMDLKAESRLYPFFNRIWKNIDAEISYPDDLVRNRVTGSVTVQIEVDRAGVFTGRILETQSDQMVLEAYVLAMLTHALSEPLPRSVWMDRESIALVTTFNFRVFGRGELAPQLDPDHSKNILKFARSGFVDPKLNEVFDRVFTKYIPPIIPIPGGLFIDFVRAYKMVENLGKLDEQDLRTERIALIKEQWKGVIQKRSAQQ